MMPIHRRLRRPVLTALFVMATLALGAADALASHFRYGSISWSVPNPTTAPRTVQIRFDAVWRWDFNDWYRVVAPNGNFQLISQPPVGALITSQTSSGIPGPYGEYALRIFSGATVIATYPVHMRVTGIDNVADTMTTTFVVTHTFASPGNYRAEFNECCRLSNLVGPNADDDLIVTAGIGLTNTPPVNRQPVAATLPIMNIQHNTAAATFAVPAFDPDGDPLTFTVPTFAESGLSEPVPPQLSINGSSGVVTWNTIGKTLNGLYAAQFRVSDNRGAYTTVDLLLRPVAAVGQKPTVRINGVPDNAVFNVVRNTPMNFIVTGSDPEGAPVTLTSSPQPIGSLMTPSLPTSAPGNVSSHFTWTPAPNQIGSYAISYSAIDGNGLQDTRTATINVTNNPPTIMCTASGGTIEATGPGGALFSVTAQLADADDDILTRVVFLDGVIETQTNGHNPPLPVPFSKVVGLGSHSYRVDVTDNLGPPVSCVGTFSIVDTTAPSIALPSNLTLVGTIPPGAPHTFSASATDTVDPAPAISCSRPFSSIYPYGTTTVSCTATDDSGNASSGSFTVTVTDPTPPVVTVSITGVVGNPLAGGGNWYLSPVTVTFTATDPETAVTGCPPASFSADAVHSYSCTATSGGGDTSVSGTITIDQTPPVFANAHDRSAPATGPKTPVAFADVSASDSGADASGLFGFSCTPASGSLFLVGSTTVKCDADDNAGNRATAAFVVRVIDSTAPVIDAIDDQVVNGSGPGGAVVSWTTLAVDAVDGVVAVGCTPPSGSSFGYGVQTVTCTATDAAGNGSSETFTVTVNDPTPPVATATITGTGGSNGWYRSAVSISFATADPDTPVTTSGCDAISFTTDGKHTYACTATSAGGSASASGTIEIDQAPPAITGPAITAPATGPTTTVAFPDAAATDDSGSGIASFSCTPASGSPFPVGQSTVSCSAEDNAGNPSTHSFVVTVVDGAAPVFGPLPDLTVPGTPDAQVSWTATAEDVVSGPTAVTCSPVSGSTFPYGTTEVICQTSDAAGNSAEDRFLVTVTDTTPPVIAATVTGTLGSNGWYTGNVAISWSVTDAQSTVSDSNGCGPASVTTDVVTVSFTCTATSEGGTHVQTVTVKRDASAPVLTTPGNLTVDATSPTGATVSYAVSASDPTSGGATASCTPASGSAFPMGSTTVSCTASNNAGLTSQATFTVTVRDSGEPGKMYGEGDVRTADNHKVEFEFVVLESRRGFEWGDVRIKVKDNRRGRGNDDRFDARTVDDVRFTNAPDYGPGRNSKTGVDTVQFSGTGKWEGRSGYRYVVAASDRGEPGRGRDTFTIEIIKVSNGEVVFSGGGTLTDGNVQSTRLRRPWSWWYGHRGTDDRDRGRR